MRLIIFICISLIVFEKPLFSQSNSNLYSFFVAGHTYGAPGVNNPGLHPPFLDKFEYIKSRPEIQFGVLTGDIVSPNPVAQDWDEVDSDIDSLGLPVYFAVGNHDMENRPLYENRYGNTYYYYTMHDDLFIVLDPNIDGWNISGDQLAFLKDLLTDHSSKVDNIYVFFHQVLWREGNNKYSYIVPNSNAGKAESVDFWTDVEPLFHCLQNRVLMFAGDLGAGSWGTDVVFDTYDNISLIGSGMGGEIGDNFIVVNVNSNKSIDYDLICLTDTNINCLGELEDYQKSKKDNKNYKLYPIPVNDWLTIEVEPELKTTIQLFNMSGQFILEEQSEEMHKFNLNLSKFEHGIYFLRIFDKKDTSTIQFTKF